MASTPRTDPRQEFAAIVYADDELVRAEFEAIVDANWDQPEPPRPTPPAPPWRPGREMADGAVRLTGARSAGRDRGVAWHRERAPPGRHCPDRIQKGR
ncbi:MAG TPA: hypothetical protein VJX10_15185 [Pseudonocardiaceae bacterium]|nr:hypothetical protein [Pseudonocardiaceae bacterium]